MDTSEPMDKPTTPQPTAGKEQNTQKDQIDNNNSGMFTFSCLNDLVLFFFFLIFTYKIVINSYSIQKNIILCGTYEN